MKNIYLSSTVKKDKSQLVLSIFFIVVFLSGPFSGRYFELHRLSHHTNQFNENNTGTYSFFISLHDSTPDQHLDVVGETIVDKPEQTIKEDTSLSVPLQKVNQNMVIW